MNADGNGLKMYGVAGGAGLTNRKWRVGYDDKMTVMNTGMKFGKRGSGVNNIKESYVQFN